MAARNLGYCYDLNGNINSTADARFPVHDQGFQYDALDRLILATGVYQQFGDTYDADGTLCSCL